MRYPIAIEAGSDAAAFGVVVPDLPGCFSAGDTLDEAVENAREAIELWIETVLDDGGPIELAKANNVAVTSVAKGFSQDEAPSPGAPRGDFLIASFPVCHSGGTTITTGGAHE